MVNRLKFVLVFIAMSNLIYSQINSDRPGYSDPPQTVGLSKIQWENGLDFTMIDGKTDVYEMNFVNSMIRYGISDYSEIRLTFGYSKLKLDDDNNFSGLSNLGLGTKLKINESENELIPSSSLIMNLNLPYGDENFKPSKLEPALVFVFENGVSDDFTVGYNIGFEWVESDISYLASLSIAYNLNDDLNITVGYLNEFNETNSPKQFLEFAIGYMVMSNLQIDLWIANTPFYETKDNFIGVGFSWLLN